MIDKRDPGARETKATLYLSSLKRSIFVVLLPGLFALGDISTSGQASMTSFSGANSLVVQGDSSRDHPRV